MEFCDKCCCGINSIGDTQGCDQCKNYNPSCDDCQLEEIMREYNQLRKESLKSRNVTFGNLNHKSTSSTIGPSNQEGQKSALKNSLSNTTNGTTNSASSSAGNNAGGGFNVTGISNLFSA